MALPSSACTVTAGAAAPTSMPRSCAGITRGALATATNVTNARVFFLNPIPIRPVACSWQLAASSYPRCCALLSPQSCLDDELPHLHKVILRYAQHDQRKDSLDPQHPGTSTWQSRQCSAEQANDHQQRAHTQRKH